MIYGSETWLTKVEHEVKLDRSEMSVLRRMCWFNVKDKENTKLRKILGLEPVSTSVARYHGTTAVPFFYGTSTVAFTVLFSTAIPQVSRFFGTVLVRC